MSISFMKGLSTEWTPPDVLPDLSSAEMVAIDLETMDPDIKSKARVGRLGMDASSGSL